MNALVLAGSEPAREDGGVGHSGINPREWRWSSGDGGEKGCGVVGTEVRRVLGI